MFTLLLRTLTASGAKVSVKLGGSDCPFPFSDASPPPPLKLFTVVSSVSGAHATQFPVRCALYSSQICGSIWVFFFFFTFTDFFCGFGAALDVSRALKNSFRDDQAQVPWGQSAEDRLIKGKLGSFHCVTISNILFWASYCNIFGVCPTELRIWSSVDTGTETRLCLTIFSFWDCLSRSFLSALRL